MKLKHMILIAGSEEKYTVNSLKDPFVQFLIQVAGSDFKSSGDFTKDMEFLVDSYNQLSHSKHLIIEE